VSAPVLDHVAVATRVLADGWDLFCGVLGGSWAYGGNDRGYWWGQLQFRSGPKIELLTPTGGPDGAFLDRFLTARGPGPHHLNFSVSDIGETLARVRALGIEPVQVNLDSPVWKEAFLHPRDAYGIVIQVAQQSGPPPQLAAPDDLPEPGAPSDFVLAELDVDDVGGAIRLYCDALGGEVASIANGSAAELTWQRGARIRLTKAGASVRGVPGQPAGRGLTRLRFSRGEPALSPDELARVADLTHRLGVSVELDG
jgi:methylmalonyl-CoA/ethylmalonyl-CoA epimerase